MDDPQGEIRQMDNDSFTDYTAHEGEDCETMLTDSIDVAEKIRDQIAQRISDVPADGSRSYAYEKSLVETHKQWCKFVSSLHEAHGMYLDI